MNVFFLNLLELVRHPLCNIWSHSMDTHYGYCDRCHSAFCGYSWMGFELRYRIAKLFIRKDCPF